MPRLGIQGSNLCRGMGIQASRARPAVITLCCSQCRPIRTKLSPRRQWGSEVAAFYWTVLAPDIVNSGQEEQGLVSV
jgi:hypothetical protein